MRSIKATVIVVLVLIGPGVAKAEPPPGPTPIPQSDRFRQSCTFTLAEGQDRIELAHSFIIEGSDSVRIDGRLLSRGDGYRIDNLKGTVVLVREAEGGENLLISYRRYPFPFKPVFASRMPGDYSPLDISRPGKKGREKAKSVDRDPYRLRLSGSKTVGFSVGSNRGLGIDQSLKVTMVGKIAKDLEVNAFLTDNDLPIQPEGNTEELKHLDKVFVQVKSKHTQVELGDFNSSLNWSDFTSYNRELRGINTKVRVGGQLFYAGGGMAKGRFRTASFMGREGVQGPYELISSGEYGINVILSGTEMVFLDGRLMKRGSENEYTIDYNRGTVTFTEKVPVTADSEIVIDYQMGERDYERTILTAGWESPRFGDALELRMGFFRESDDSDNPVTGDFSDEEMEVLAFSGDDPDSALASGIQKVDPGAGNYVLVPADSLPEHFEFADSAGDYRLRFYEVGSGEGDYAKDGFSVTGQVKYTYVGAGRGSFRIGRKLPLPESKQLFSLRATAEKGYFFMDAEGDVSHHDGNTASDIDDGDNTGGAFRLEGGVRRMPVHFADLSLLGDFSSLDDRFTSPDKTRKPYFYRDWNLENVPLSGRESIGGVRIELVKGGLWSVGGGHKFLSRGEDLSARKSEVEASVGDLTARGLKVVAMESRTGDERDRKFARGEGVFSFWHVAPRAVFDTERYRSFVWSGPDTGRYYYRSVFSIDGRNIGGFRGGISYSNRHTDNMMISGGDWYDAREDEEIRLNAGYTGGNKIVELFMSHRRNEDLRYGSTSRSDLARVRHRDSWLSSAVTSDIGYRISSGEERRQEKAVVFVGENEGDYDSEGREVGKKRGDYMVFYLPGGDRQAVRTVELNWRLSLGRGLRGIGGDSGRGGFFSAVRRNVSCDHFFSVTEKSSTDDLTALYTLSPRVLQRDDVTLYGMNRLRQEWSFLNGVKKYNLRLTYSREDIEDNRMEGAGEERYSREVNLRADFAPFQSLTISLEGGSSMSEKLSSTAYDQDYRVDKVKAAQTTNYHFSPATTVSLELGYEGKNDRISSAEQSSISAEPALNSSIGKRLHVTAFLKLTYTDSKTDEDKPLFFLEEGLREDWSVTGQYRFSRYVSFGANYTGRREKDYMGEVKTVHAFKMESRAHF